MARPDAHLLREETMAKIVNCECGEVVRGDTDDELVAAVSAHVEAHHPDLVGKLSRDDVLAMAEEA
jgi:predicted small metal-binding protein